ncbi:hypothetical protein CTZ27_33180 [Streptomyces griseocarneus]|nr:hypothetical protein CTZ27_33180 [Streptomyces griseocarneus]
MTQRPDGTLLRAQELEVCVTYYAFGIQESHDVLVPVAYPDGAESGVFLQEFPMRLDLGSGGHTHTARMRVEVWDSAPEPDRQHPWDEVAEAKIETASGELAIWEMGRADDVIVLGKPGLWNVRAASRGREEARRLSNELGPVHGAEHWLLQFWPYAA